MQIRNGYANEIELTPPYQVLNGCSCRYGKMGKYNKTLSLEKEILVFRRRVLPDDHLDTASWDKSTTS